MDSREMGRKGRSQPVRDYGPVIFATAATAVVFLWLLWGSVADNWAELYGSTSIYNGKVTDRTAAAGSWGDSFGAFNALFGALGFGAIISTLYLQYVALNDQRRDQHLQRFEASFFELVRLMRELRSELEFIQSIEMRALNLKKYSKPNRCRGFDAAKYAVYEVRHWVLFDRQSEDIPFEKQKVAARYESSVHDRFESRFAPYFRIIYTILARIREDQDLSEKEKAYYGNLLRSQLTSYEIVLLAMNATSPVSKDLFDMLHYFHMLKYLPKSRSRRILEDIYQPEAFAARD